jgi:hypothetical protein
VPDGGLSSLILPLPNLTSICVCIYQESRPCRLIRKTCQFILSLLPENLFFFFLYFFFCFFIKVSSELGIEKNAVIRNQHQQPDKRARKMNQAENFHLFQSFIFFF